jgi:protein TonB
MSDTALSASPAIPEQRAYSLSDDLSRLCLPSEFKDSYRRLAWVDSVCFLFLVIGLIGLRPPRIIERPVKPPPENVPVVFTPPEEQPKPQPVVQEEQPQEERQETVETPQIPTVVAANTPNVAFAVPVEGPVVLAPVSRAPPPPLVTKAPPAQPRTFVPGKGEGGTFPWPTSYPREAMEQRLQGTVMLYVVVDTNGMPTQVDIKDSSRHSVLDRFAQQWVKSHWRWLPGETRYYYVPFQFVFQ